MKPKASGGAAVRYGVWLAGSLAVWAAGCGRYEYVPVSGRVTLDGQPLAGANVRFQPTGGTLRNPNVGRGSLSVTDGEGRFTLRVDTGERGAVARTHRVSFSKLTKTDPPRETVPARYNVQSELTFAVPAEGTAEAHFELKSR